MPGRKPARHDGGDDDSTGAAAAAAASSGSESSNKFAALAHRKDNRPNLLTSPFSIFGHNDPSALRAPDLPQQQQQQQNGAGEEGDENAQSESSSFMGMLLKHKQNARTRRILFITTALMVLIPISTFYIAKGYVFVEQPDGHYSNNDSLTYSGFAAVFAVNIVMAGFTIFSSKCDFDGEEDGEKERSELEREFREQDESVAAAAKKKSSMAVRKSAADDDNDDDDAAASAASHGNDDDDEPSERQPPVAKRRPAAKRSSRK